MFKDQAVSVYFSDVCNLQCKYCYLQTKNTKLDADVLNYIKSDRWIGDVQKHCPDMTSLGFWGEEPTLRLHLIEKHVPNFKILFPKLEQITLSSNFVNIESLKTFVDLLPENVGLFIQVSIDGNKNISLFGRGDQHHDQIVNNIFEFASYIKDKNKDVNFQNRSTWNKEMLGYLSDKKNFTENLNFFKDLTNKTRDLVGNNKFEFDLNHMIAFPYSIYTKEDGINFSKILQNILDLNDPSIGFPYRQIFRDLYKDNMFSWVNISNAVCSAGKSAIAVFEDNVYICHSVFNDFETYVSYSNRETMKRLIQTINNFHALQIGNDVETARLLLKVGLIQKSCYEEKFIHFTSVLAKVICFLEIYSATKSFHVTTSGMFKLLLNGAVGKIIELDQQRKKA